MLRRISRVCSRFPWWVIAGILLITVFMVYQIRDKAYFEADLTKFLPKGIEAVKSDDYYKKNFNYQDTMLIGVEKAEGSVLEPDVLRSMEAIVLELKNLKAPKTFDSMLTGKRETRVQSVGIDPDSVTSVANMEDAILDQKTGSVVSGSVIRKLKQDYGIPSPPGAEERLPPSDADLARIIPALKERIMGDRSFRGNLVSEDLQAATIRVSMFRKWDYKKRYAVRELSTAIDADRLKNRFQGQDSAFPFTIFGKTINGIRIDDAYIQDHSQQVRNQLRKWLNSYFEDALPAKPELARLLSPPLTTPRFQEIMRLTEADDFFSAGSVSTWADFCNQLYEFTLNRIDPFSRENLEFQLHNVYDIFDFAEIYNLTRGILAEHDLPGVEYHVAGMPVVIGVVTYMMQKDMRTLVPIAVLIVFLILLVSFRSLRGVIIPALTVMLAVVWTLGIMAMSRVPFSLVTTVLPVILLGIGTAYGIHLLNRYYEDAVVHTDRRRLIETSVTHVGVAVVMAALTTIAGFSSLATSSLTALRHFGIFSAVGVGIALLLTLTLTPAMLSVWPLPKRKGAYQNGHHDQPHQHGQVLRLMRGWAEKVIKAPRITIMVLGGLFLISLLLMTRNYFEGSMMTNFKENNPLYRSDRFINHHLSGTTNINLVFRFRDRISFENPQARQAFSQRVDRLADSWSRFVASDPKLSVVAGLGQDLIKMTRQLPDSTDRVMNRIDLLKDMLNEEYAPSLKQVSTGPGVQMPIGEAPVSGGPEEPLEVSPAVTSADGLSELADEGAIISPTDDLGNLAENTEDSNSLDALSGLAENSSTDDGLGALRDLADETAPAASAQDGFLSSLFPGQVRGLRDIHQRLYPAEGDWRETARLVLSMREHKSSAEGLILQRDLNRVKDFLAVDIKQPTVLHKLEDLYHFLTDMKEPVVVLDGTRYRPTGFVMTPVDFVRKFYRVFYHDDDPAYDRLPDVDRDGFTDPTLTDRSIIGVVLNQALSAGRDQFEAVITPDLKAFQVQVMIRDDSHTVIEGYVDRAMGQIKQLFPSNDPYIAEVKVGGSAPTGHAVNQLISRSQVQSILLSFAFVFIVTFFIFRSAIGGIYSLIPLAFTVILNFGLIALMGGQINMVTMMVASISIGTGVDYTIHFLERLKIQLKAGDSLNQAYIHTVMTSGRAILVNAAAVALGFLVLVFSIFVPQETMGILMAATMAFSSLGALTLLPAIIIVTRPRFLEKVRLEAASGVPPN